MKHKLIILICALSLFALDAPAQTWTKRHKEPAKYKHEWRFGVAGYPVMESLIFSDWGYKYEVVDPGIANVDRLYKDYHGTRRMIGLISAEYSYNRHKHLTFSVGGYASAVWEKVYDYSGKSKGINAGFNLDIVPTIRGNYIAKEKFSLYSSVGIGVSVGYFEDWNIWPTFILVPVGITFGDKIFGFAEFGTGLLYIGGAAGIGYRF